MVQVQASQQMVQVPHSQQPNAEGAAAGGMGYAKGIGSPADAPGSGKGFAPYKGQSQQPQQQSSGPNIIYTNAPPPTKQAAELPATHPSHYANHGKGGAPKSPQNGGPTKGKGKGKGAYISDPSVYKGDPSTSFTIDPSYAEKSIREWNLYEVRGNMNDGPLVRAQHIPPTNNIQAAPMPRSDNNTNQQPAPAQPAGPPPAPRPKEPNKNETYFKALGATHLSRPEPEKEDKTLTAHRLAALEALARTSKAIINGTVSTSKKKKAI